MSSPAPTARSSPSSYSDDPRSPPHTPQLPRMLFRRGAMGPEHFTRGPEGFISGLDALAEMVIRMFLVIAIITVLISLCQAGRVPRRARTPYPSNSKPATATPSTASSDEELMSSVINPGRPMAAFCFFKKGQVCCVIQHPLTQGAYIKVQFQVAPCQHSDTCTCQAHGRAPAA